MCKPVHLQPKRIKIWSFNIQSKETNKQTNKYAVIQWLYFTIIKHYNNIRTYQLYKYKKLYETIKQLNSKNIIDINLSNNEFVNKNQITWGKQVHIMLSNFH